jgi:hypothetical protein
LCWDALDPIVADLTVQSLEPHLPRIGIHLLRGVPQLLDEGPSHREISDS